MSDDMWIGVIAGFGYGMFIGGGLVVSWLYARFVDGEEKEKGGPRE